MAADPEGLVTFEAGGVKYTAIFGFKAMKATETHYDLPLGRAIQKAIPSLSPDDLMDPAKVAAASADIRVAEIGKLFEFALLKHHPELTEDDIADLIDELGFDAVGNIITASLSAAQQGKEGAGGAASTRPPKGSRSRKIGSRSLVNG